MSEKKYINSPKNIEIGEYDIDTCDNETTLLFWQNEITDTLRLVNVKIEGLKLTKDNERINEYLRTKKYKNILIVLQNKCIHRRSYLANIRKEKDKRLPNPKNKELVEAKRQKFDKYFVDYCKVTMPTQTFEKIRNFVLAKIESEINNVE